MQLQWALGGCCHLPGWALSAAFETSLHTRNAQDMVCLLVLLTQQPEAGRRAYWARRWAYALDALELVAAATADGSLWLDVGGRDGRGSGSVDTRHWSNAAMSCAKKLSDSGFAPGEGWTLLTIHL